MKRASALLALAFFVAAARASAQSVLVTALDDATSTPIFGALAYLTDERGRTVKNLLTDERGRALFVGIAPGRYRLRVEMIGMSTAESEAFPVAEGETLTRELRLGASAIVLEDISVEAEGARCRLRAEQGYAVAQLWEEARKALTAAAFTDSEQIYRYRTMIYERELGRDRSIQSEEQRRSGGYLRTPFESRPAEDLMENGFVQSSPEGDLYYAPDATVLLSDAFLDTHCFRLQGTDDEDEALVGLAFEPVDGRRRTPDIGGTLWLERGSAELRSLEFTYRNLDPAISTPDVGGRVQFRRLPNGTWIIPEWRIRMPNVGQTRDLQGRGQLVVNGYREVGGIVQQVQESGGRTVLEAETATIEGIVVDSLGTQPVRGARVGLLSSSQRVFSDGGGRFRITDLTAGAYQVVFTHPSLEAVGFVPEGVPVEVSGGQVVSVRLTLPAIGTLLAEACPVQEDAAGDAMLTGRVLAAGRQRPLPGAVVRVTWTMIDAVEERRLRDLERGSFTETNGFQVTAGPEGYYRVCGLPERRRINVVATYEGAESPPSSIRELDGPMVLHLEVPVRR